MDNAQIIALIKREVVPAVGCTEPAAVALCTAYATEALGTCPERIDVLLSGNMLKNAMGVGIPGTGMTGLPIAVALGALIGKSSYQLEVLKDVCPQAVADGKAWLAGHPLSIGLTRDSDEMLYIEVLCTAGDRQARAIIAREHTRLVYLEGPCVPTLDKRSSLGACEEEEAEGGLTLRRVFDFATTAPLEDLEFINDSRRLNEAAAEEALKGNYGHELGKTLSRPLGKGIMGDSIFSHIISATSSACDARMAGAKIPVMSNSGSGNQGIAATLPVVVFARENHNTEEELTRALVLSHLTVIYIKQSLGRLSCLCGCVVASTGSSCGITWLMGGGYDQVAASVKNMIANLAGMVCDGAKPSCALKVSSGVSTAVLSAMLAVQNHSVTSVEGLIEDDVDRCIHNLTRLGSVGMQETDKMVLDIMTHKKIHKDN
ncbi:MAG: L-serine ammonia-lyase, iron-sulfur-dependent, subunit alpha [Bacteroidales bacterium]|nr:L-serine ammonia-lyase, iron-sulfur-dependent, subunit alpha [Bacteroidales bacterium]